MTPTVVIEDRCQVCDTVLHRWTGPAEHEGNAVEHDPTCRVEDCGGNVVRTREELP